MKNETVITPDVNEDEYRKKRLKSLTLEFGKGILAGAVIGTVVVIGVNLLTSYLEAEAES